MVRGPQKSKSRTNMLTNEPRTHGSQTCAATNTARNAKRDCKQDVINSPYDAALYLKNGFSPRHVRFEEVALNKPELFCWSSLLTTLWAGDEANESCCVLI